MRGGGGKKDCGSSEKEARIAGGLETVPPWRMDGGCPGRGGARAVLVREEWFGTRAAHPYLSF